MGIWLPSSSPDSDYRNGWSFPMIKQTYWVPSMCSWFPGTSQEAWPCPTLKVHLSSLNQQVGQGRMSLEGPAPVRWSRQRPPALHPHPLTAPQVTHAERRVFENSSARVLASGWWCRGADFAQYLHRLSFSEAIERLRADGQVSTQVVWPLGHRDP